MIRVLAAALVVLAICWPAKAQEISYQGELRQSGVPFDGAAAMKFVIIDDDTGLTIWSSDGSVLAGDPPVEPAGSVMVPVGDGLFSVMLGLDPGMAPITGADALNLGRSSLRLWVSTGGAFERLSDQMLASSPSSLSVRQVDPEATGRLARWDGMRLASTAAIFVDGDGNVGIGTTDPIATLDVNRYARITRNEFQAIDISSGGIGTGNTIAGYSARGNLKPTDFVSFVVDDGRPAAGITGFRWFIGEPGSAELAMLVNADGEVGINTDNPITPLDVNGIIRSRAGFRFPDGTIQTTASLGTAGTVAVCLDSFFPCMMSAPTPAQAVAACEAFCPDGVVSAATQYPGDCTAVLDVTGQSCRGATGSASGCLPSGGGLKPALCCVCRVRG